MTCIDGLELSAAARERCAVITLRNCGTDAVDVLSHVDAGDRHYDWYTIELERHGETRVLRLYDDRNESAPVTVSLPPGGALEHVIDVAAWARREVNGGRPLAAGTYRMSVTYEVTDPDAPWRGMLRSEPAELSIPRSISTLLRGRR